jgi:hypothetical protein
VPITSSNPGPSSLLRHFVAFCYKSSLNEQGRREVVDSFLALCTRCKRNGVEYIVSIETGRASSPEGVDQGLVDGFLVTFSSASDRDYYVGTNRDDFDPVHDEFKNFVKPKLAVGGAFVFDFTVEMSSRGC